MNRRITVVLLFMVCLVQLGVPAAMIARKEIARRNGESFRFRCAPVDPVDPFRGRYVALSFEAERFVGPVGWEPRSGQTAFASIEVDDDGFARVAALLERRPEGGPFVKCRIVWSAPGDEVVLALPFSRYYMEESKARSAERLYRESVSSSETSDTWAEIAILDGYAVLRELYLDGVPVREHDGIRDGVR